MQCFGPAFTLRCWPADNLTIHRAVELAAHGDVLVIDGGSGATRR
jgi:regulator of RNase E activity RraA